MMRRLVWLVAGVGIGVAVSQRITRSRRGSAVVGAASSAVTRTRRVFAEAVADGRAEMQRREASLREVLAASGVERGQGLPEGRR